MATKEKDINKLIPHQFFFDKNDLEEFYDLAQAYVKKKKYPVKPSRAAAWVMRLYMKRVNEQMKKELDRS